MSGQQNTTVIRDRSGNGKYDNSMELPTAEVAELLENVGAMLDSGNPRKAIELLQKSKVRSPWTVNAMAVCLMRMGDAPRAIEILKGLVVTAGVCFRTDVPTVFLTNFATALLMTHNVTGSLSALASVYDKEHPAVQRLQAAIRKWKSGFSLWQKIGWYWGNTPPEPIELDFPPGDI